MSMNRRALIGGIGLAGLAAMSNKAMAGSRRPVTLVVFQRGAVDGLNMLVPYADDDYARLRPNVRIAAEEAIDLDGFFGLHPALESLHKYWQSGQMAAVHAAGSPNGTRSHFSAQEIMETGRQSETATLTGWLGRHLAGVPGEDSPFRSVALSTVAPRSLQGGVPPLAMPDFNVYNAVINRGEAYFRTLDALYRSASSLDQQSRLAVESLRRLQAVNPSEIEPRNGAEYPNTGFARTMKKAAQLIRADLGTEVIAVDIGGWDTHTNQNARLQASLSILAGGLDAFMTDMGADMADITVLTMSEFGRRATENGSGGTDHGHGNVMLALGGGLNGGQVYGQWPGLADADLDRGDLQVTTDYRQVLSEFMDRRLGNSSPAVFPGYQPTTRLGLFA